MRRLSKGKRPWTIAVAVALLALPLAAGSLDPPGPPAPTMKTLDQVEPRVPVHAADLPMTISAPGAYYLAEDIDMPAGGITIASSNVTIDLSGFRLRGNVPGDGIAASGTIENIIIRNGFVVGWLSDGINLEGVSEVHVIDVHASRNFGRGIAVGADSRVVDSTARFNAGTGILVGARSQVIRCQAYTNDEGIVTGAHAVVTESNASGNSFDGIIAGNYALVAGSIVADNGENGISGGVSVTVTNSQASGNVTGISLNRGLVTGCQALQNSLDGIAVSFESVVRGNLASGNVNAGVKATIGSARIEGNHVVGNGIGVEVTDGGSTIFHNTANANLTDYSVVGGNDLGPIGTAASSTSPWANIGF